ncbi:3-dehydroquinate synthase [Adhaeribacter aquaticus]|uniref:3-dehydroquinate synthase n=1 Tax=Adhaeribacter aquaticus TaxID=299567 RepID=UPI0012F9CA94|nr:3-dehydroquinate synthase [Adhaeribacter aquaticus]
MAPIYQQFQITFKYTVHFTEGLFNLSNPLLRNVILEDRTEEAPKVLFVIDHHVAEAVPALVSDIQAYSQQNADAFQLVTEPVIIPGGEQCKNDPTYVQQVLDIINDHGIDRHSYIIVIGGGAILDMVGYAASIAHRGIRHIRIPTTVLAQDDSGVGVKNSINAFGKKNFLGCFTPPNAVINDFNFLLTLSDREWRAGIAEAIKVALIKDASFFQFIQENAAKLAQRDMAAMQYLIRRSAEMHVQHIGSGDPFEKGSSRPLDFGHWSAHKIEPLSNYRIRHGEAVAMGIALDSVYSHLIGWLTEAEVNQIISVIKALGFELYATEMTSHLDDASHPDSLLHGLQEFREHLGGQLTIMLLEKIGYGVEVHEIDDKLVIEAIKKLQTY